LPTSHLRQPERCLQGKSGVHMPTTEHNLGPGFDRRLKAALDAAVPPSPLLSSARYRSGAGRRSVRLLRLAPALIGAAAAAVALTAAAATGSPNPAVWTQKAGSVINSVGHPPSSSPKPKPKPSPSRASQPGPGSTSGHATPSSGRDVEPTPGSEPTDRPEPSAQPQPSPSPEPSSDGSGGGEPSPSPSPGGDGDH
jgi:hypothetical protein